MELKDSIEKRTSIREFTDEAVRTEDLKELVRRAGLAPSINNQQPWRFFVIKNKELLHQMALVVAKKIQGIPSNESMRSRLVKQQAEMFSTFFKDAPAVIVMAMHPYEDYLEKGVTITHEEINRIRNYPDMQSAGAAMQNILLSAVDLGYGACWMSSPLTAKEELEELLAIEKPWNLISFAAIGKPVKDHSQSNKKPVEDIIEIRD